MKFIVGLVLSFFIFYGSVNSDYIVYEPIRTRYVIRDGVVVKERYQKWKVVVEKGGPKFSILKGRPTPKKVLPKPKKVAPPKQVLILNSWGQNSWGRNCVGSS